jgi:hypothetical protein
MKAPLALALAAAAVAAGCNKDSTHPAPEGTNSAAGSATNAAGGGVLTAPVDYLGALAKDKQSMEKTIDTAALDEEIRLFQVDNGRYPKDLNELVKEKYISKIPQAPYGTKLDYNPATGEIKVVKQ